MISPCSTLQSFYRATHATKPLILSYRAAVHQQSAHKQKRWSFALPSLRFVSSSKAQAKSVANGHAGSATSELQM